MADKFYIFGNIVVAIKGYILYNWYFFKKIIYFTHKVSLKDQSSSMTNYACTTNFKKSV